MLLRLPSLPLRRWRGEAAEALLSAASFLVFAFLDLLDLALCFVYRFVDAVLEEKPMPCYCFDGASGGEAGEEKGEDASETLHERRNMFREMGLLRWHGRRDGGEGKGRLIRSPRWSDCCCEACVAWIGKGDEKLHLVMKEPSQAILGDCSGSTTESVIFLHGFLSSSSFWSETVFPNVSEIASRNCRLFAVDLLGFGRSPKPADCLYKLKDHIGMIERTVIEPFQLDSFHLVAHSMGCIIALAIAEKHHELVKSITLIAPPYLCSTKDKASHDVLNRFAARRLWPPLLLGSSIMSWYEHLGRSICFIVCRNHRKWEWIVKLFLRSSRNLHFMIADITKHTHHSAWHTMHNVICGGAKSMEEHLEALNRSGIPAKVIHGSKDQVVPLECSYSMKSRVPSLHLQVIHGADHNTVVLGREKDFTRSLENLWFSSAERSND